MQRRRLAAVFTRPRAAQIVLDSWRFLQAEDRIALYGYCAGGNGAA